MEVLEILIIILTVFLIIEEIFIKILIYQVVQLLKSLRNFTIYFSQFWDQIGKVRKKINNSLLVF
jgi:hypothetical protein